MKSKSHTLLITAVALAACLLSACNKGGAPDKSMPATSASAPMGGASAP